MKIYIMRHGETKWNKRSKLQGQVDIPLAPKGIEQAQMTAEGMKEIPFDHIFSSPLKRAYKTAQIVRMDRPIDSAGSTGPAAGESSKRYSGA